MRPVIHLDNPPVIPFTGWSGQAVNYAGLPAAASVDGEFWMVLNATGSRFLLTYKASGLYLAESGSWRKINNAQLLLNDAQFAVYNTADNSKMIAFDVSTITTGTKRTATWQDSNGTVAWLSDIPASVTRNNYVLVKTKADFPTPSGGIITLADDTAYEINGTIVLGTDRIVVGVSNIVYGVDKSNDILVYTGVLAMFTAVNQDFSLNKVTTVNATAGSQTFDFIGDGTNRIEIAENIFGNSISLGELKGGFATIVFRNNLLVGNSDGITVTGVNEDLFVTDNLFDSFVGAATMITITDSAPTSFHTIIISRNMFESVATQTVLNISAAATISDGALIDSNVFEGAGTYLTGINAVSPGWTILYKANIGLVGLLEVTVTVANQVSTTTSKYATYSSTGQSTYVAPPNDLNPGADTIELNLIVEQKISDGSTWWFDLYNYTDGAFIEDPPATFPFEVNFNASASNLYEKAESGFIILPVAEHGKSLGPVFTGSAGGGNRTTTQLNAELRCKIYKA